MWRERAVTCPRREGGTWLHRRFRRPRRDPARTASSSAPSSRAPPSRCSSACTPTSTRATREKPYTLVFSDTIQLKVWFATAAFVLAIVQIFLALRLYDKIHWPKRAPAWLGDAHRLVGIAAFALTCRSRTSVCGPWASSPSTWPARRAHACSIHSITGCFFFGVVRHQGALRATSRAARLDAPCRGWAGVQCARRDLRHEQSLVLRRPARGRPPLLMTERVTMGFKRFVNIIEIVVGIAAARVRDRAVRERARRRWWRRDEVTGGSGVRGELRGLPRRRRRRRYRARSWPGASSTGSPMWPIRSRSSPTAGAGCRRSRGA